MFHLRDEIANEQFGGRVKDIFGSLGTGLVKTDPESGAPDNGGKLEKEPSSVKANKRPKYSDDSEKSTSAMKRCGGSRSDNKMKDESTRDDVRERAEKRDDRNVFKKPGGNFRHLKAKSRGHYVPDHRKNPDKWTKYSLADVDQMTDKSNTRAALDFLKQLKKDKKEEEEEAADLEKKVVFKRRKERKEPQDGGVGEDGGGGGGFSGGVRVMPQYEVGRKKEKKIELKKKTEDPSHVSLKLSHLDQEEEED